MGTENEIELECGGCSRVLEQRFFSDVDHLCLACFTERESMLKNAYKKILARKNELQELDSRGEETEMIIRLEEMCS